MSLLSKNEMQILCNILHRNPTIVEEGIAYSMWSEHCSYKSTRTWLKTLHTQGTCVIQGPGENAGIVDIGDNQVAVFKIESHNHPSFIEPYQGAATGVGGIMRDIFTMGARPIANLNVLCFGDYNHPSTPYYVERVIAGIADYGNSVGVPTIGGETNFHSGYNNNILVNAMTVGIAQKNKIFFSKASGVNNLVVYVGAQTGRDGIHGATMASSALSNNPTNQRITVQAGDPFTEKQLMDACLELMTRQLIIAIQDMGAAGLTSASIEMSYKGHVGMEIDLNQVPIRESDMTPYELMLSESQERMLLVVHTDCLEQVKSICQKYNLYCSVIGKITNNKHLILKFNSQIVTNIPIVPLIENSPSYQRPYQKTKEPEYLDIKQYRNKNSIQEDLISLISTPECQSKKYIFEQYDYLIGGQTIIQPGIGSSVVKIHNQNKALAMNAKSVRHFAQNQPELAAQILVATTYRNLIAVGARPLAITNNMNFGNPENPIIMGQFVETIHGMRHACKILDYPVVSGNVSLYNETNGQNIPPTPVVGGIGIIYNLQHITYPYFKYTEQAIFLIGDTDQDFGGSLYARYILQCAHGHPPPINLENEKKIGLALLTCIKKRLITQCKAVGSGGVLLALASMVCYSSFGCLLEDEIYKKDRAFLFSESQSRYIIACDQSNVDPIQSIFKKENIAFTFLGTTTDIDSLHTKDKKLNLSREHIRKIHFESRRY